MTSNWTPEEYAIYLQRNKAYSERKAAELERYTGNEPLEESAMEKAPSGKFILRIESHRRRLLDEDNTCEKYLVDTLRYAGLIPADDPETLHIEVTQFKCKKDQEEHVVITISPRVSEDKKQQKE